MYRITRESFSPPISRTATGPSTRGEGCDNCLNTGYTGRVGIFELLTLTPPIRQMVQAKASSEEIKARAIEEGMSTLRQDGINKAFAGITTLSEVMRVTIE